MLTMSPPAHYPACCMPGWVHSGAWRGVCGAGGRQLPTQTATTYHHIPPWRGGVGVVTHLPATSMPYNHRNRHHDDSWLLPYKSFGQGSLTEQTSRRQKEGWRR